MCVNMSKTIKEERLRWVLPIYNKEVKLVDVAKFCPYGKRTLESGEMDAPIQKAWRSRIRAQINRTQDTTQ